MQSKVHVSRSNRAFLSPIRENGSGSRTEKGAIRAGNVDFTLHCCISITDKVKINDLQKSIVTGLLYVHIDFEVIWTFLQGATWILNPSGYCAL